MGFVSSGIGGVRIVGIFGDICLLNKKCHSCLVTLKVTSHIGLTVQTLVKASRFPKPAFPKGLCSRVSITGTTLIGCDPDTVSTDPAPCQPLIVMGLQLQCSARQSLTSPHRQSLFIHPSAHDAAWQRLPWSGWLVGHVAAAMHRWLIDSWTGGRWAPVSDAVADRGYGRGVSELSLLMDCECACLKALRNKGMRVWSKLTFHSDAQLWLILTFFFVAIMRLRLEW